MLDMCGICVVDTFEMDMCGICKMCWICVGYVWCEIRQQSSEEPCDETSFGKKDGRNYPCMVCLPTLTIKIQLNLGKYSSPMDPRGYNMHIRV